jgi:hypothetical protein
MAWLRDPARHALSAKGVCTGRFQRAQLNHVASGNRVAGTFGKASGYDHVVKKFGNKYVEGSEVEGDDYERAIAPLFDTLAEADILVDKGDLKGAIAKLELAERQFGSMCQNFNVIRDEDNKEYIAVARQISDKAIARSRIPPMQKIEARSPP